MTRYVYSVLRFVPDPARGEFVNVGVIAGNAETGEWQLHEIENKKRARALAQSTAIITTFTDYIGRLLDRIEDDDSDEAVVVDEEWLTALSDSHRNVVQLTAPAPVSATSLDDALGLITGRMLVDPVGGHLPYIPRSSARSRLRSSYSHAGLKFEENVFAGVRISVGELTPESIDFAVANGKPVQLAQAWSFQTPDEPALVRRFRSWSWTISKLRLSGGTIRLGEARTEKLDAGVRLEAVVVPPRSGDDNEAVWAEAQSTFRELEVAAVEYQESDRIARDAVSLLSPA